MKHCIRVGNSLTRHSDDAVRFPEETAEDIAVNTSHVEETAEEIAEYGGSEESTEERGAEGYYIVKVTMTFYKGRIKSRK